MTDARVSRECERCGWTFPDDAVVCGSCGAEATGRTSPSFDDRSSRRR